MLGRTPPWAMVTPESSCSIPRRYGWPIASDVDDSRLLVVTSGVTSQLENFSGQVLHDDSQVDWSSGTNAFSVVSLAEQTMDMTDWELETSTVWRDFAFDLIFHPLPRPDIFLLRVYDVKRTKISFLLKRPFNSRLFLYHVRAERERKTWFCPISFYKSYIRNEELSSRFSWNFLFESNTS